MTSLACYLKIGRPNIVVLPILGFQYLGFQENLSPEMLKLVV